MNIRSQRLAVWAGPLLLVCFAIGLVALAQFIPPPKASDTARQVADLYANHTDRLRAGFVLMMVGGAFIGPFSAAISVQMKRIEGGAGPWTYTQLACGGANVIAVTLGALLMASISFRPERDPEITLALHEFAWFLFVMYFSPLFVQMLSVGLAVFSVEDQKVFPRWAGYFNFWAALLLVPAVFIPFFKTGAFAWHGLFEFWLAATVFFGWIAVMTVVVLGAIRREEQYLSTHRANDARAGRLASVG